MTPEPVFCPYCNSRVAAAQTSELGQGIVCPRCGETFAFRARSAASEGVVVASPFGGAGRLDRQGGDSAVEQSPPAPAAASQKAPGGRWSNRKVAGVLLAGMVTVALATLVYALVTQYIRRDHDTYLPKHQPVNVPFVLRFGLGVYIVTLVYLLVRSWTRRDVPVAGQPQTLAGRLSVPSIALLGLVLAVMVIQTSQENEAPPENPPTPPMVRVVPPVELAALAYLPADTDIAVGVHVAEAMQTKKGKTFMGYVELAAAAAGWGEVTALVEPKDVDHVVVGLNGDRGLSQGTMVVQTRERYDLAKIRKAFGTQPGDQRGQRPVYALPARKQMRGLLWCAGDRTLVVVFKAGGQPDLEAVPLKPRTGAERLPGPLRDLFQERRLGSGHAIWLIGRSQDPNLFKSMRAWLPLPAADQGMLKQIVSVRAGLRIDPAMAVYADLEARDSAGADEVETFLRARKRKGAPLAVRRQTKDRWVSVQVNLEEGKWPRAFGKP